MTSHLREGLDDLATDAATRIVTDDLARTSWAAGRRRRHRRWAVTALAIIVAAGTATLALPDISPVRMTPADAEKQAVTGYPKRIEHQWIINDLPDRPGPIAGLLQRAPDDEYLTWEAIAPDGHRWRIPVGPSSFGEYHPTLSRDGRYLGYLADRFGPYVIHDLVAGTRVEFIDIGSSEIDESNLARYWFPPQTPSFWSPDSQRLLLLADTSPAGGESIALLLEVRGRLAEVPRRDASMPAGWVDDNHLAWTNQGTSVSVTRLDGTLVVNDTLHPGSPWQDAGNGQWTGALSPTGDDIMILDGVPTDQLRRFSMDSRRELYPPVQVSGHASVCGISWAGSDPVVSAHWPDHQSDLQAVKLADGLLTPLVRVYPGLEARCLNLAEQALLGEARGQVKASWDYGILWWWREILVAMLSFSATSWWLLRRARLRRSQT